MTILFGTVAAFVITVAGIWFGDLGVYLPLTVWMIFAIGNHFGIRNSLIPALVTATLTGLIYDRGAAGFIEISAVYIFWGIMVVTGRKYVFGTVGSWLPGLVTGMTASLILYGARLIAGGWRYGAEWVSAVSNILFCGMMGVMLLPVIMWFTGRIALRLGLPLRRAGSAR